MDILAQLMKLIREHQAVDLYGFTRLVLYDDGSGHLERRADGSMLDRQAFVSWRTPEELLTLVEEAKE